MKISTKSALLSALTITTMLSSSLAMAQLTPGKIEREEARRGKPKQHGLTPGQVEAENNRDLDADRERERLARDRQREVEARERRERERERERQREIQRERERQQEYFRRILAQQEYEREIARQEAMAREQYRLAEEARRLQEERNLLARQGSAAIAFSGVTRKTGGEWLRVTLQQPMQLSSIEISVLEAKAKTHQIIVYAENGQSFEIHADGSVTFTTSSSPQFKDLRHLVNRITAIDTRIESMGAKSVISIQVNSLEGAPTLSKEKFSVE